MLTWIDLRHFKCFRSLKLPLRALTLLSGANASGKSSAMQALALLHQTMREHEWSSRLMLNGAAVRLGATVDVIDREYGRRGFGIALTDDDRPRLRLQWEFEDEGERDAMSMRVRRARWEFENGHISWDADEKRTLQPLHYLLPPLSSDSHSLADRLRGLTYLTAERLGPREHYLLDDPQLTPVVGSRGEYAVSVLHSGRDSGVLDKLALEEAPPTRFRQVEARMSRFFPGCVLAIDRVPRASAVTLGIRVSDGVDFLRPVHTGFGVTQVLPIVVAALSAGNGSLLLIENPEAHLHPAGQAAMGVFLAEVASAGVQVIVETHSDHVLNGIRRAVKKRILSGDDVALHFFRPRDDGPQVQSPVLDAGGNIDSWPEGFFDQFDGDMNDFAGWS